MKARAMLASEHAPGRLDRGQWRVGVAIQRIDPCPRDRTIHTSDLGHGLRAVGIALFCTRTVRQEREVSFRKDVSRDMHKHLDVRDAG